MLINFERMIMSPCGYILITCKVVFSKYSNRKNHNLILLPLLYMGMMLILAFVVMCSVVGAWVALVFLNGRGVVLIKCFGRQSLDIASPVSLFELCMHSTRCLQNGT